MAKSKEKPKEKPKAKVAPKADIDNGSTVLNSLTDGVGSVEVEAVDVKALAQRALDLVGTGRFAACSDQHRRSCGRRLCHHHRESRRHCFVAIGAGHLG